MRGSVSSPTPPLLRTYRLACPRSAITFAKYVAGSERTLETQLGQQTKIDAPFVDDLLNNLFHKGALGCLPNEVSTGTGVPFIPSFSPDTGQNACPP